jgi:pimeloyl-ACP methyl ester carboxylesterase
MERNPAFDVSQLAVITGGTGDPVILVHGFGSNKLAWQALCDLLAGDFTYHAIDLPGSGESPAPRGFRYSLEQLADVLADFIVLKDLRRLTLVGASLGATVILLAMLRNRETLGPRVRALCLIGAVAYEQDYPLFMELLRGPLGPLVVGLPPLLRNIGLALIDPILGLPPQAELYYARREVREAMRRTARLITPERLARYSRKLKTVDVPALVVWGSKDEIVPLRQGRRLARDLPNAKLAVIEHCGHWPHDECPELVARVLKEFVQTADTQVEGSTGAKTDT